MKIKIKEKKCYLRRVLDEVQSALGRDDIGATMENGEITITDMEGKELNLTNENEDLIKNLPTIKDGPNEL